MTSNLKHARCYLYPDGSIRLPDMSMVKHGECETITVVTLKTPGKQATTTTLPATATNTDCGATCCGGMFEPRKV